MAVIISSTNNKGGVGKTSTIVNLASLLANKHKKKVLVIDLDQQCNLSQAILGKNNLSGYKNAGSLFDIHGKIKTKDLIIEHRKKIHIIPGKRDDLYSVDDVLKNVHNIMGEITDKLEDVYDDFTKKKRSNIKDVISMLGTLTWDKDEWIRILKNKLSEIESDYDYIFLDLPPSVSRVPKNAWVASDYLLVPISDNFALNGTEGLIKKMIEIKRDYNEKLKFIFFFNKVPLYGNMFGKEHVNKEYMKIINNFVSAIGENETLSEMSYIMEEVIRDSKDIEKSYGTGKNLTEFKKTKVLSDYVAFTKALNKIVKK